MGPPEQCAGGPGLLAGVRVLDLTTVLAGPYASYQLSLLGADVVKIEPPGRGDVARDLGSAPELRAAGMGASFLAQNSGKRSVTVNLKSDEGREILARLIEAADVLVENMRPGVLERLGFSWARMRDINPRLVYCALSGFGQSGPLASRPAYDQIVQGMAGMCAVTGHPDGNPLRVGFPVCDTTGGMAAAFAICAGLLRRERTQVGAMLDISMLETGLTSMGWVVSDYLIGGRAPDRIGNENATSAPSGAFTTGDGTLVIAANTEAQYKAICDCLGREDLLADPRFKTREDRKRHRVELREELERTLAQAPAQWWEDEFAAVGVPAGRVLSVPEALDQPQLHARDLVHEVAINDGAGAPRRSVRVLGSGIHIDGDSVRPRTPPPRLGEHTDAVLTALGYTRAQVDRLRVEGVV